MARFKVTFVFICAISLCLCEIDIRKKAKLVNGFVEFYNRLPNEIYTCDEGFLQSAQQTDISNAYDIEVSLKVSETHNPDINKYLKCTARVADLEGTVAVMKHQCQDDQNPAGNPVNIEEEVVTDATVTEAEFVRKPIQLDNEVQTDTAVTSGEQFIAIPREEPKVHCIGCSSHVNTQAQGVNELADIGVRQLNSLEPDVQHTLASVVEVERQVQVVNGVRYMLTLLIDYNTCSHQQTDPCVITKACKVTILEKPWMHLSDGSKYRAILSNNCTKEWRFGDDGVVPPSDNKENNNINLTNPDGGSEGTIKVVHNVDVQSKQQVERTMTDQDVKSIEEQIIPLNQFSTEPTVAEPAAVIPLTQEASKEHVIKLETENQHSPNSIQSKPQKIENLDDDKKKTIDELLNYFNFAGFDTNRNDEQTRTRMKRSFENDLNALNIAHKFQKLKKNIENAKYIYTLAQSVVDYLNEMDLEVKHRVLKDVISAEMESESSNNFYYIQFRTIVPCKLRNCKAKDTVTKICNAVVDNTEKIPQILNVFCHDEDTKSHVGKMNTVPSDDPVLIKLVQESLKKIEAESNSGKAMKLNKIIYATTQRVSGTLTKISMLIDQTDCDKTVPLKMRMNCSVVEEYGSQICDVIIHERHWLKESSTTYSCTDRPIDIRFSIKSKNAISKSPNDPVVIDMIQEALRNLEIQSKRNNKQIMIKINSVSTQLVAGFLTHIEFVVGLTTCPTNVNIDESAGCKLLENEPLKTCTAKVWDRSWIEDGRQVDVSCKDPTTKKYETPIKSKQSPIEPFSNHALKNVNVRTKRDQNYFVGGETQQDPSDSKYQDLAKESLQKYLQDTGNSQPHKVVSVEKVTTQVVAGSLIKIYFKISPIAQTSGDVINCHSKIWKRPWLNSTEFQEVSCEIDKAKTRAKRGVGLGGAVEKDPSDSKYQELAKESLHKYLQNTGNSQPHKVVSVEKVTAQVVAGRLIKIYFKISPIAQTSGDVINCHSKIRERPWLNSTEFQEVSCEIDKAKTRAKRGVGPGGVVEKDPSDSKYQELAKESLHKYLQNTGNSQPHKVVSVEKVTAQVVAGRLIKIYFKISPIAQTSGDVINCHSKIWERPWLNSTEFQEVSCEIDKAKTRAKRGVGPGGVVEKDPSDSKYQELAKESLHKYLQNTGNSQPHKVVSVEKVTAQVVAGRLIKIYFKISPIAQTSGDVINCHSKIWERPWLNSTEFQEVSCEIDKAKTRAKRGVGPGGVVEKDPSDSKYQELAKESLHKYLQNTGNSQPHKVVSVEKVTAQVVAGRLIKIYFKISPIAQTSGDVINCHSKIWERPWLNSTEFQEVSCEIDKAKTRAKRGVGPGGVVEKDPSDSKYQELAKESLHKYLQNTGNSQPHKVVSVEKVTAQVVAGRLIKIYFKISPIAQTSGDVINCHSKIWERPWLNSTEFQEVSCEIDKAKTRTKKSLHVSLPEERMKRNIITGGFVEQDPKKLQYKELAEISLQKYLQDSSISQPHEIVDVQRALTQVVSGLRTVIHFKIAPIDSNSGNVLACISDIWQKSWENTTKISVNCELDNFITDTIEPYNGKRLKRNTIKQHKGQNKGGERSEDPSKEEFKEVARDALREYQKKHKNINNYVLVKIKNVTTKVVSGIIYNIDFTAAHESCAHDVSVCNDEMPVLNCLSKTIQSSWRLQNDIEVSCNRKRNKRKANLKDAEENNKLNQLTEIEILDLDERGKRQAGVDDDYMDEDTKFYYADRAIQQLNDQLRSSNLYKLISVHTMQSTMHMDTPMIRVYFEAAETYCLRNQNQNTKLQDCEELDANNHKLCLARVWPSPDDEMVIQQVSVVCEDDEKFEDITGISIAMMLKASLKKIEESSDHYHKLIHLGAPQLIPTLDSNFPMLLNFVVGTTNCSKYVNNVNKYNCFMLSSIPTKACSSYIWLAPNSRTIVRLVVRCGVTEYRSRRAISLDPTNATVDDLEIQKMLKESLEKLEMSSTERYKQKLLQINSCKTKVTSGKITTIDFDVAFTSCLKYEWVDDMNSCGVLEHLPRRHCVAEVWDRLWVENGRNIEVSCEDEVVPLEVHVEFQSAATATALANRALKYIEAKYPHPRKQKVIRIYSMDKQVVAGVHYRMKMEVGLTNCSALSGDDDFCVFDKKAGGVNKFCRVNVWLRPWTDHPPNFRVSCDYQEGAMSDMFHQLQAEHLFRDFMATYSPEYVNDREEIMKRFEVFKANIKRIHMLNTHERGTATYGVTRFADLTYEEFTKKHMGLKQSLRNENQVPMLKAQIPNVEVPETFDWREHGAVTPVKDQGSCGSCWAFSVTGNIEGQWQLKTGKLVSLSEQELVDCDKMDDGCNGGLPDNAYRAIEQLGGLELESDYPYEAEDDKCVFNASLARVQISSAVNITSNETAMAKWLVEKGPISIGINANAMQFYMGGVSHPWKMLCDPKNLDHGVLIVGYGIKNYPLFHKRLPYWIVKNSWGPSWGEQGYYRVFRGDGTCGVNQMASSAVI